MNRTRVEIGSLVIHQPGITAADGAALQRTIEAHLRQLIGERGGPVESHKLASVQVNAGVASPGGNVAGTVARALFKSIQGKM
jgi:hypothetical protein